MFVEQRKSQKQDLYNSRTIWRHIWIVSVCNKSLYTVLISKHSAIIQTSRQFLNGLKFCLEFTWWNLKVFLFTLFVYLFFVFYILYNEWTQMV